MMQPPMPAPPGGPQTYSIDPQRALDRLRAKAAQEGNRELAAHVDGAEWFSAVTIERERADQAESALVSSLERVTELEGMIDPGVLAAHDSEETPTGLPPDPFEVEDDSELEPSS